MEHRAQAAPKPQTGRLRSYPAGASETEQDEPLATYEGWCRDAEAHINWHGHIDTIYNLIRGCNPSPGASTTVVGRKLRIFDVRKYPIRRYGEVTGRPGEICQIDEQRIHVVGQGGRLEILTVKPEGGSKTSAAAFAASTALQSGMTLGT